MLPILSIEQIKERDDLPEEIVEIPAWGGAVRVRGLDMQTWHDLVMARRAKADHDDLTNGALDALLYGVIEPKFTPEDAAWLVKKSMRAIQPIVEAFNRLNGFGADGLAEARKKLSATENSDSSTTSPTGSEAAPSQS